MAGGAGIVKGVLAICAVSKGDARKTPERRSASFFFGGRIGMAGGAGKITGMPRMVKSRNGLFRVLGLCRAQVDDISLKRRGSLDGDGFSRGILCMDGKRKRKGNSRQQAGKRKLPQKPMRGE
jgi:hypothetical protein